jgi:hypothetical protein
VPTAVGSTTTLANYDITLVNGTLTVTKASLTVTPVAASRLLGAADPPLTATISGFVNGERESALRAAGVLSGQAVCATNATASSPVGSYDVTCTVGTLTAANYTFPSTVTGAGKLRVLYNFSGFLQPIDNNGVYNKAKAGSTIPVKFSLAGDRGLGIFSAQPASAAVGCSSTAATDAVEETTTATTSGLKYDPASGQYIYNWKTTAAMAGTCQRLTVRFADGTSQTALFNLTR